MFGFFGSGKKQDSPAPQPQNTPQQPQRIIEKGIIKSREDTVFERGHCIRDSFGTTDLDVVLERYAPEHSDMLKKIPETREAIRKNQVQITDNQQIIYDKLKEQDKKIEEQGKLIKAQCEAITAMQEQLKLQNERNERLLGKLDFISGVLGEMYEAAFKKQMGKEPENKIHQK